jgi:hypothetical protein
MITFAQSVEAVLGVVADSDVTGRPALVAELIVLCT